MSKLENTQLILGNSNKRFSGVTSTMMQVLPHQQELCELAVLGPHHLEPNVPTVSFRELVKLCKHPLPNGNYRVFHARRNDEMIQALIAKKLFGAKLKIAFTSTAQRHHSKFTKWLMAQMDSIISTCSAAASYLEQPPEIIIPHGIDTSRYQPAQNRREAWRQTGYPGERGIGIFGRIRPSKGIDTFIDAILPLLKKDSELTALVCGETTAKFQPYLETIKQKVAHSGLSERILFIGKQSFDQLPKLFQAVSLTVAASRNEGFGLTVLEAMASGTPVVATTAGAWQDIIQDGKQGYCVPIDSPSAMREKIELTLSQQIDQLGAKARHHIEQHFTVEREAEALCHHLLSLA